MSHSQVRTKYLPSGSGNLPMKMLHISSQYPCPDAGLWFSFLGPSGTFHSLWDTVYDRGGSARLEHAQGRRAGGRKILGFGAQRVTEDGAAQLEVRLFGWWLYTLKGLCVPGGHRSRTDGAHRRAGLEGLWERASKHVEPPTSESDKRGKSPGNGRLHFFHRPQRFTSLVRGWSW